VCVLLHGHDAFLASSSCCLAFPVGLLQVSQAGFDPESADLQWQDGIVWKPFETLEELTPERLRTKWMLKTTKDAHSEWPRIQGLETVANRSLREHWRNRGVEKMPDREVSAWSSFLASYTKGGPSDATTKANASMMALTSKETLGAAVEVTHMLWTLHTQKKSSWPHHLREV